eukprot:CAMPEP_0184691842 /NCGR_PEP_ID=MMETSP0313-20130426/562_1 /TAXON_ID=2792 /ORGANISM="Porphyridium aerugineum, Strain SAG 1380-2" /LENGTH=209 /DNA_ID=CAMNT_0027149609 /DNA_START=149 /DNA_END=778 /DNA_ORIENTATION=+
MATLAGETKLPTVPEDLWSIKPPEHRDECSWDDYNQSSWWEKVQYAFFGGMGFGLFYGVLHQHSLDTVPTREHFTTDAVSLKHDQYVKRVVKMFEKGYAPVANKPVQTLKYMALFASAGAVYVTTEHLAATVRLKNDPLNAFLGGALVGSVHGIRTRTGAGAAGGGICLGLLMAGVNFWRMPSKDSWESIVIPPKVITYKGPEQASKQV